MSVVAGGRGVFSYERRIMAAIPFREDSELITSPHCPPCYGDIRVRSVTPGLFPSATAPWAPNGARG
ncbi:hypothetical protein EMIT0196MI5_10018 [Pseudomonas sp. IT-196MI5]